MVFTNGVFDLLHRGHVTYLEAAARLGDVLVVGVNDDASVRRLGKGDDRPIVPEGDRAFVVAGLRAVAGVVLFGEDTPLDLIRALQPDVLVKGGDYDAACTDQEDPRYIVGSAEVRAAEAVSKPSTSSQAGARRPSLPNSRADTASPDKMPA